MNEFYFTVWSEPSLAFKPFYGSALRHHLIQISFNTIAKYYSGWKNLHEFLWHAYQSMFDMYVIS